jgi:SAM-dependent methyltransferase
MICKLCRYIECSSAGANGERSFYYCPQCGLIFVSPAGYVSFNREKIRYCHHDNSASSKGYVSYLTGVAHFIDDIPIANPDILDFGSGHDYVLTRILREKGFGCSPYDPLYDIGKENLSKTYDIVILCETIEHLRDLNEELELIGRLCKPDGYVVIHTMLYDKKENIAQWWYAMDETHINFFNIRTLQYLSVLMNKKIVRSERKNTVILGP